MKTLSIIFLTLLTALQASCQLPYWGTPNPVSPPSSTCRTYEITSTTVHTVQYEYQGCDGGTTTGYISGIGTVKEICALVGTVNWSPSDGINGNINVADRKCCTCTYPTGINIRVGGHIVPSVGPAETDGTVIQSARIELYTEYQELTKTLYFPTDIPHWESTIFEGLVTPQVSYYRVVMDLKRTDQVPPLDNVIWATVLKGTGFATEVIIQSPHYQIPVENIGQSVVYTTPLLPISGILAPGGTVYALKVESGSEQSVQ